MGKVLAHKRKWGIGGEHESLSLSWDLFLSSWDGWDTAFVLHGLTCKVRWDWSGRFSDQAHHGRGGNMVAVIGIFSQNLWKSYNCLSQTWNWACGLYWTQHTSSSLFLQATLTGPLKGYITQEATVTDRENEWMYNPGGPVRVLPWEFSNWILEVEALFSSYWKAEKLWDPGTSLAVWWLRFRLPLQEVQDHRWSLVGEIRSQMPCSQKTKTKQKQKQYCNIKLNRRKKCPT